MTLISGPRPFDGTPEEAEANRASHLFIYTGTDEDMDVRCTGCDCRPSHVAASYPCGAHVPRVVVCTDCNRGIKHEHTPEQTAALRGAYR